MLIKFLIIPINGKKTLIQYSKSGFDEETRKYIPTLRRTDLLRIAKNCNIQLSKEMYDFEISNKIIHWKPSSLSYSRKELTKLTKKDIISLFNIHNINTQKTACKFNLIESFLQEQKLYCYENLDEENILI